MRSCYVCSNYIVAGDFGDLGDLGAHIVLAFTFWSLLLSQQSLLEVDHSLPADDRGRNSLAMRPSHTESHERVLIRLGRRYETAAYTYMYYYLAIYG
jgi:hypothetical protein